MRSAALSVSAAVLLLASGCAAGSTEQEALLRQIATMSNNLNQLARKANTDGIRSVAILVDRRVRELGELLDRYAK